MYRPSSHKTIVECLIDLPFVGFAWWTDNTPLWEETVSTDWDNNGMSYSCPPQVTADNASRLQYSLHEWNDRLRELSDCRVNPFGRFGRDDDNDDVLFLVPLSSPYHQG